MKYSVEVRWESKGYCYDQMIEILKRAKDREIEYREAVDYANTYL